MAEYEVLAVRLVSRKESLASGPGTASRPDWGMWRLRQSSPPASWAVAVS